LAEKLEGLSFVYTEKIRNRQTVKGQVTDIKDSLTKPDKKPLI
jgi:hypothetical protein